MKPYQQQDLGHPRLSTAARLEVTMPDRSVWRVPVQIIADSRDHHFKGDCEDTIRYILEGSMHASELISWASNNMDWKDVREYAELQPDAQTQERCEQGWVNGDKTIVGAI